MGAFDTYAGRPSCPRCGAVRHVQGQTKFFDPEFGGVHDRWFELGARHPLDASAPAIFASATDSDWWRVSEGPLGERWALLEDADEQRPCSCGASLALVLTFRVSDERPTPDMASWHWRTVSCLYEALVGTVELVSMELLDLAVVDVASRVDFAPLDVVLGYDAADWEGERAALTTRPEAERVFALRAALARHAALVSESPEPWTHLKGVFRCEACGDERARRVSTRLSHPQYRESFFGPAWHGGVITAGMTLESDPSSWLRTDDRGFFVRVSAPAPDAARVVVLSAPEHWGCRCGAGRPSVRASFDRVGRTLTFAGATLRVVRTADDLRDVDFAEAPRLSRDVAQLFEIHRPSQLPELQAAVLREWAIP